jgi:hypothetical protein
MCLLEPRHGASSAVEVILHLRLSSERERGLSQLFGTLNVVRTEGFKVAIESDVHRAGSMWCVLAKLRECWYPHPADGHVLDELVSRNCRQEDQSRTVIDY